MEFVLRIFFSGLITFVPSSDGKELNVVLIDTPHEYTMAGDATLAHHRPLLLARAATCENACRGEDYGSIAQYLYANKTATEAQSALNSALLGGGAWELAGSELKLVGPQEPLVIRKGVRGKDDNDVPDLVPTTVEEREDFTWVADLGALAPNSGGLKAALSGDDDPGDLVVARLKLRSGTVMTYSVIKIDEKARPVHFRKPSGQGPDAPYTQALANWVEAKIHISGTSLEIVDTEFAAPRRTRKMTLHPQEGFIELAVLNLPPYVTPDPNAPAPSPQPGQHFQIYYDFFNTPPAQADRLIPHQALVPSAAEPQTEWSALHPRLTIWSDLLEQLGLSPRGKGPYEVALCPITRY
jgi:hypothetical protein